MISKWNVNSIFLRALSFKRTFDPSLRFSKRRDSRYSRSRPRLIYELNNVKETRCVYRIANFFGKSSALQLPKLPQKRFPHRSYTHNGGVGDFLRFLTSPLPLALFRRKRWVVLDTRYLSISIAPVGQGRENPPNRRFFLDISHCPLAAFRCASTWADFGDSGDFPPFNDIRELSAPVGPLW